ncbi:Endonuclease/exonuclease/phosphatase [candidate division TM7 genomosp. GTL1]|nr:Endonuclease/exonuclease/phosphatase [candidate division TM7 genomosp. GTL1]
MKLLQLNVWQNRLHKQVLDLIAKEQPDILCLQEICSSNYVPPLFPGFAGFEAIQAALPDYESHFAPCFSSPLFGSTCSFGNAIFSRFPLADTEIIFINGQYQEGVELFDRNTTNIRNLQRTAVKTPEGEFCLINHHAFWVPNEMGSQESVEKMQRTADVIKSSPRPLVFSGDLNVVSKSPAMKSIHALLRDLTEEYNIPTTLSGFGKVPNVPCDHICVSEGIQIQKFGAKQDIVSDHLALTLEFGLEV